MDSDLLPRKIGESLPPLNIIPQLRVKTKMNPHRAVKHITYDEKGHYRQEPKRYNK